MRQGTHPRTSSPSRTSAGCWCGVALIVVLLFVCRLVWVQKCPFEAIEIINLPKNLERDTTHRYGPNSFKLHRLPMPRPGQVLGLVGTNGIGQSITTQYSTVSEAETETGGRGGVRE